MVMPETMPGQHDAAEDLGAVAAEVLRGLDEPGVELGDDGV